MIITGIISAVTGLFQILAGFLPNADTTTLSNISTSVSSFRTQLAPANWWFPIDQAFAFIASIILIESSILTFRVTRWIIAQLTAHIIN